MGRVYRGRDSRIGRDVAIKVLPADCAVDPGRLRRFEQEARASGALTHPNVLTLYNVGTDGGRPYLVTELLEGETLRQRLVRGAIPPARACEVAAAIARGLAAAHAKGIVHRDLKPENVMITRDGRVKILDFGIAKLRASPQDPGLGTAHSTVHTDPGVMVGTAGYMAPEQVRGQEADGRADVFALGAMLFEMLSGRRAFDRESRVETLHASLHDDPPLLSRLVEQSPALGRIVQRCLEKDPEARFQSAGDLAFALETTSAGIALPLPPADGRPRARRLSLVLVVAGFLIAAVAGGAALWRWAATEIQVRRELARFPLPLPPRMRFSNSPAISPDGTTIVYGANEGPVYETQQLYVRRIDQLTTVALPGTDGGRAPFFSPDGTEVAFWAGNKLKRIALTPGAAPAVICAVDVFLGGTWMPDGTIIFGSIDRGLQRVPAVGGSPQPLTSVDAARSELDHHTPAVLPGGGALLVTVHDGERRFRVDVLTLATGARRTVIDDGFDARYVATGHLVYAKGSALYAAPFDLGRLAVSGPAAQVTDGLAAIESDGNAQYALSDTGTLVFATRTPPERRTLAWVERSGITIPLPLEPRMYWTPRLSPDGKQLAVVVRDGDDSHIWTHHFERATFTRLTQEGENWAPVWTQDSATLIYVSEKDGRTQIMRQPAEGSAAPELLLKSESGELAPGDLSRDGRTLFYTVRSPTGTSEIRTLDLASRSTQTLRELPDRVAMPVLSPDGRWLGFTSWTTRPSIFVKPVQPDGPARLLVEAAGYTVWSRSGDRLYFRTRRGPSGAGGDGVFELPFDPIEGVATGPERQLFRKAFTDWLGVPGFDVAPDGRFLLVLSDEREAQPRELIVVLHVDDELRRRTP